MNQLHKLQNAARQWTVYFCVAVIFQSVHRPYLWNTVDQIS